MVFWLQNPKVAYVAIPKQSLCWRCFANSHPTSSMTSKTKARVHSQAARESYRSQTQSDMRQPLPASQPQTLRDPG